MNHTYIKGKPLTLACPFVPFFRLVRDFRALRLVYVVRWSDLADVRGLHWNLFVLGFQRFCPRWLRVFFIRSSMIQ